MLNSYVFPDKLHCALQCVFLSLCRHSVVFAFLGPLGGAERSNSRVHEQDDKHHRKLSGTATSVLLTENQTHHVIAFVRVPSVDDRRHFCVVSASCSARVWP